MLKARHVGRLLRILAVLRRHRLLNTLEGLNPGTTAGLAIKLLARSGEPKQPLGERLRLALQDLGPIFVKFGQALSTRPDLLPPEVARELAKLQDRVPPFPGDEARAAIERAYGKSPDAVFAGFETEALASASIAQVHAAKLPDGKDVVVKVLRPGISATISQDVEVLKALAAMAHRYFPATRRLRPRDVVDEYAKTLEDELDLMREAANAAQLRRNFDNSELLYVPEVYFDFCRPRVLVIERVTGIPVSDIDTLNARGTNLKVLADRGVEIFFTQVFRHNFFHADMHPGNIFVDVSDPQLPNYIAIDFGIVGTLTPRDQHYLAGNLLAFFKRDYTRVAELHVESGWVPAGTRVDEFESAIRTVCEPIFNKPLKDISFGQFLVRLFGVARRFNMGVQPQLILLQKTLLNIEGLGRQLYPDLDLWQTAKPFLEEWMREQASGRELFNHLRNHLPELSGSLQDAPQLAFRALQHLAEGRIQVETAAASDQPPATSGVPRPLVQAVAGGGLLLAATVSMGLDAWPPAVAATGGIAGLLILIWALTRRS